MILSDYKDKADAIVYMWHLGTETGHAVADVLTGKFNPSGHLPVSFPRCVGQVPVYYNYLATGKLRIVIGQESVDDTTAETMKALQD